MAHAPSGTVAFLFTDIEGSTALLQRLGESYGSLLETHYRLLREAITRHHGYEFNTQGDSMFAAFANAADALATAVEAQCALSHQVWPGEAEVHVRMALHAGEPTLAGGDYFGLDVHHAARLVAAASGGQVLLSQRTRDLIGEAIPPAVSLLDLGRHRLKDLPSSETIYQLVISGLPNEFPPLSSLESRLHNLPEAPTSFVAREEETRRACDLLKRKDVRLLTLTGMGGIGKTRLAQHVAQKFAGEFEDGVWFIPLAAVQDPTLVADAVADVFEVRKNPDELISKTLQDFLRPKKILLVLDNFEQLVGAALFVADLIATCPHLKILLTSRTALHLRGEQELPVPPLPVPDLQALPDLEELARTPAVALFLQRVQASQPEYSLNRENAVAAAAICARLDGLALAIELAAARVKALGTAGVRARLDGEFGQTLLKMLTSPAPDAPARHQTLRAAIAWSHDLLSPDEQRMFRRMAIFKGGCDTEAVQTIVRCEGCQGSDEPELDAMELLASLADKSLLRQSEIEIHSRFTFLESVRHFALERLIESGEEAAVRAGHAHYYWELARLAHPHLQGKEGQAKWMARLERDQDNGREAMRWLMENEPQNALAMASDIAIFLRLAGRDVELRELLENVIELADGAPSVLRAVALREAGEVSQRLEDFSRAAHWLEQSIEVSREGGIARNLARTLRALGEVERGQSNHQRARELFEESTALERAHGDKLTIATSLQYAGSLERDCGELERAQNIFEESESLSHAAGNMRGVAGAAAHLAAVAYLQNNRELAHVHLERSLRLFREGRDKGNLLWVLRFLGTLALEQGDASGAGAMYEEYLHLARELCDDEARMRALWGLARVAHGQGRFTQAQNWLRQTLALAQEAGKTEPVCALIEAMAQACAQTQPERAACLFGTLEGLCRSDRAPLPPYLQVSHETCIARLRQTLGENEFEQARRRGAAMSLGQLMVFALEE